MPQGIGADLIATLAGWGREDVDALRADVAAARRGGAGGGHFDRSVLPVDDAIGLPVLERDEFIKPRTTLEGLASLKVAFAELGAMGFDAVALARYPQVERIDHVHTAGNSSGIVDGAAAVLIGSEAQGQGARPDAARRASSRPRCPAPTRRSCSPARCRRRARRSPRPG